MYGLFFSTPTTRLYLLNSSSELLSLPFHSYLIFHNEGEYISQMSLLTFFKSYTDHQYSQFFTIANAFALVLAATVAGAAVGNAVRSSWCLFVIFMRGLTPNLSRRQLLSQPAPATPIRHSSAEMRPPILLVPRVTCSSAVGILEKQPTKV